MFLRAMLHTITDYRKETGGAGKGRVIITRYLAVSLRRILPKKNRLVLCVTSFERNLSFGHQVSFEKTSGRPPTLALLVQDSVRDSRAG